jgi:hypothetical protein
MSRLRTLAVAGVVSLASCTLDSLNASRPSLAPDETALRTSAAQYVVATEPTVYTADIPLTYSNPLGRALAVPACRWPFNPVLEKLVDGEWVRAFQWPELACIGPPLVIPRGAAHSFVFALRASRLPNTMPVFEVAEIPGTYRFVWWVSVHDPAADTGVGAPLPLELRVSNAFELRL